MSGCKSHSSADLLSDIAINHQSSCNAMYVSIYAKYEAQVSCLHEHSKHLKAFQKCIMLTKHVACFETQLFGHTLFILDPGTYS